MPWIESNFKNKKNYYCSCNLYVQYIQMCSLRSHSFQFFLSFIRLFHRYHCKSIHFILFWWFFLASSIDHCPRVVNILTNNTFFLSLFLLFRYAFSLSMSLSLFCLSHICFFVCLFTIQIWFYLFIYFDMLTLYFNQYFDLLIHFFCMILFLHPTMHHVVAVVVFTLFIYMVNIYILYTYTFSKLKCKRIKCKMYD